tara:strand:- start:724 stop:1008 length:285 start_codon:yes stop_codon:yes gene_type:complete
MSSPFQKAFSAKSPLKDNEELSAYKGVAAEDIPGYDDGAGGIDEEAKAQANNAPGAQFDDETAKKMLHAAHSVNYDKVVSSGGVDLGTIKKKNK